MSKQPFDVNRDLGVPKVDWNKVTSIGCDGPKRYPSELLETPTGEQLAMASPNGMPPGIPDEPAGRPWDVKRPGDGVYVDGGFEHLQPKALEEPIGETPKFNPVTQQFELPE